jgi:hypothetical protein
LKGKRRFGGNKPTTRLHPDGAILYSQQAPEKSPDKHARMASSVQAAGIEK